MRMTNPDRIICPLLAHREFYPGGRVPTSPALSRSGALHRPLAPPVGARETLRPAFWRREKVGLLFTCRRQQPVLDHRMALLSPVGQQMLDRHAAFGQP